MRWPVACACLLLALHMSGCGGGSSSPAAVPALDGTTDRFSIASAQTGAAYDVDVWLPPGYSASTVTYPVVYATDCEYRFSTLTQALRQSANRLILINVCAMGSERRWIDFTMPGAAKYFRFLTTELVPRVQASYRADARRRLFSGHSLGGEFALLALYMEDPANRFFTSIISEECSCWYDSSMVFSQQLAQPIAMEQAMAQATTSLPIDLVIAGDTTSNENNAAVVYATIMGRRYTALRATQPVYGLGHVQMDGPAFSDALTFVFGTR